MALTLTIRSGDAEAQSVTFDAPRIVLGRASGCDVVLPDPSVSHRHASIRQRGSDYIVLDEGSTNGTFVGPLRLSDGAPRVLKHGDLLRVGRVWLEVALGPEVSSPNPAQLTKEMALRLISSALEASDAPHAHPEVHVVSGPSVGKTLVLGRFSAPYCVGRGKGSDLVIEDESVSRRHIEITRRGLHVYVRELGTKNGAVLGEAPLERNVETLWSRSRSLMVGESTLELSDVVAELLAELDAAPDELIEGPVDPPVNPSADARTTGLEANVVQPRRAPQLKARPVHATPLPTPEPSPVRSAAWPVKVSDERKARRWSAADLVVALLALGVLLTSLAALAWLLE